MDKIYEMQIADRACTICVYCWEGGKICKECIDKDKKGENKPLWKNKREKST